ncbi:DNA polymerase III subunit gamma/tau [Ammoniphilus resinae]|uniref:DNA-directed DNA polymerase n=1 Tax=Ammoniphilus resinae TaxID=861532 RepID=A0ABS4GQ67_9BACL|nr:DNA polymerase III subunit gamma/tau [Ammoniphilus resinae]MBP1932415.1 DNA polymerase-3 subunit gamma/tau [Ammoniphilus resinae]
MGYRALYRVFRPQSFHDVVGQEPITRTLQNAIKEQRFSHAYLFNGPRGTGKTSVAKIFAKAVNCLHGPAAEPCNECSACIGITAGSVVDVMEIDAASNRGVEEIRDIRDKVKYAPTEVRFKVYIIDEVHMLTTEAFNALLKTLEEPPEHVIFILATTEPHRLPATIISRCQRFDFRSISAKSMIGKLRYVADSKGIQVSDLALSLISRISAGGMRDALSLFDQVYSYSGDQIDVDDVVVITGVVSQQLLNRLAEQVYSKDIASILELIQQVMAEGKNLEQFLDDVLMFYRDLLLYKTAPQLEELEHRTMGDDVFVVLAKRYSAEQLYHIIEELNKVSGEMKWSNHPKILLELGFIRLVEGLAAPSVKTDLPEIEGLVQRIGQLERKISQLQSAGVASVAMPTATATSTPAEAPTRRETPKRSGMPSTVKISEQRIKEAAASSSPQELQNVLQKWSEVLNKVKKRKIQVHAWLLDGTPVAAGNGSLVVSFKSAIHRETTEKPMHRQLIEEIAADVLGKPYELLTLMENQWEEIGPQSPQTGQPNGLEQAEQQPQESTDLFVDEAIKLVGRQLIDIKD